MKYQSVLNERLKLELKGIILKPLLPNIYPEWLQTLIDYKILNSQILYALIMLFFSYENIYGV